MSGEIEATTPHARLARRTWSSVMLAAGSVIAALTFVAHHTVVIATDTDRVSAAIEPLLDNPDIRDSVVSGLTEPLNEFLTSDAIIQRIIDSAGLPIEIPSVLDDAVGALLQPVIERTLEQITTGVTQILASEPFARSWRQIVADTHSDLRRLLADDPDSSREGLDLTLTPFLSDIQDDLVSRGFDFLAGVPLPGVSVPLLQPDTVSSLRDTVSVAKTVDPWGAGIAALLIALGIALAPRRQRAWAMAGAGIAGGMVAVVVGLLALRTVWIPLQFPATTPVAQPVADALIAYPMTQALAIGVIAAAVGGVGWLVESRITQQKVLP